MLQIHGILEKIESELFKQFRNFKIIQIFLGNFESFLHTGTQWMNSLNNNLSVDVTSDTEFRMNVNRIITLHLVDSSSLLSRAYTFPDKDFCLFKNFPHSQLVAPVIYLGDLGLECTCPLIWLHKYWYRYHKEEENSEYNDYERVNFDYPVEIRKLESKEICLKEKNFTLLYQTCNFTDLSRKCLEKSVSSGAKLSLQGEMALMFLFKWLQYVIEIFVRPILCFFGIVTNVLTLKIIRNKTQTKHFKFPMYMHIQFNALFNIFFCIIYSFSLMNICIFPKSSFCSSVLKNESNQSMKIYLIYFLGNTFRLCCNFSYFSFSSSRCIAAVTSSESKWKKWNEKLNIKLYYSIIFLVSLSFSVFKIFENKVNETYSNFDQNFPSNLYDVGYCHYSEVYVNNCTLFYSFNLVNNVLNNVLFLFLSTIIDVLMIRYSNKIIKEKRAINSPHLNEAIQLKTKLNKMIITNGTLFFISHIPEFVVTLLLIIFKTPLFEFCFRYFSCFELVEMAQAFHFISIVFQFFIFYKFDGNFLNSFRDILQRLFCKTAPTTQ